MGNVNIIDMADMQFIDEAKIFVKSGKGGDGCVSFRREKFVAKGGPNGGDGGYGGDVVIVADSQLNSLLDHKYKKHYVSKNGENGRGKDQHGKNAPDLIIPVPLGTVIKNLDTGEILADLTEDKQKLTVAKGGRGGKGNARFTSSTNQTPRFATEGKDGQEFNIGLELKILADVGILGFPNAGKSTLISKISAARPKIAGYPFTTLVPNLGVVEYGEYKTFVIADIPGIIEGAHEGIGLGLQFLKHIERTRLLIHMLDPTQSPERNPVDDFNKINFELKSYSKSLVKKPQIVVLNKVDIQNTRSICIEAEDYFSKKGIEIYKISAVTGEGTKELIYDVGEKLEKLKEKELLEE